MAWGSVLNELHLVSDFHLFDILQVVKDTNLQKQFTHIWNQQHPHPPDCLAAIARVSIGKDKNDLLASAILHDDNFADSNHCVCPSISRPFKARGALWQLQRLMYLCLNRALGKALTLNIWSCGLDPALNPSLSSAQ